jgi:hypothetical protein
MPIQVSISGHHDVAAIGSREQHFAVGDLVTYRAIHPHVAHIKYAVMQSAVGKLCLSGRANASPRCTIGWKALRERRFAFQCRSGWLLCP